MFLKKFTFILVIVAAVALSSCEDKDADIQQTGADTTVVTPAGEDTLLDYTMLDDIDLADDTTMVDTSGARKAVKIGYVNSQEILVNMPDIKRADQQLETFARNLDAQIKKEQQTMQNKYAQYMSDTTASESVNRMRAEELQSMQQRLQQLQFSSEQELAKKREELYSPIINKVNTIIKRVAQQHGYTHILDASAVLYIDDAYNVTPVVKRALGMR